jgi:uncharacterized protein YllA (UPF0747 family)
MLFNFFQPRKIMKIKTFEERNKEMQDNKNFVIRNAEVSKELLQEILRKLVKFVEKENDISVAQGRGKSYIDFFYNLNFNIKNKEQVEDFFKKSIPELYKRHGLTILCLNVKCVNPVSHFGCNHVNAVNISFELIWQSR